jgi:hypothetical protein
MVSMKHIATLNIVLKFHARGAGARGLSCIVLAVHPIRSVQSSSSSSAERLNSNKPRFLRFLAIFHWCVFLTLYPALLIIGTFLDPIGEEETLLFRSFISGSWASASSPVSKVTIQRVRNHPGVACQKT